MAQTDKIAQAEKLVASINSQRSELKGRKDAAMQELRERHGCDTIEAAETKLTSLDEEISDLRARYTTDLAELDDLYTDIKEAMPSA